MQNNHSSLTLKAISHRQQMRIGIYFNYNPALQQAVKKLPQVCWSRTYKCWLLPLNETCYQALIYHTKMLATINDSDLRAYLLNNKPGKGNTKVQPQPKEITSRPKATRAPEKINEVNKHVLPDMKQMLILKAYSPSTIRTYLNEMGAFLQTLKNTAAESLDTNRLKDYLQYCFEKLKLSENTLHSRINALKFYYEQVLRKQRFFWEIPRPKKAQQLPKHFNQDEIAAIINSITNKKHKTMLMLAYGAGLRVSEVTALKTYNIDSKEMTIRVEWAREKKTGCCR